MHIMQLQHIAEKIDRLSAAHGDELVRPGSGVELYVTGLKDDLSTFHKRLTFNIHDSPPPSQNWREELSHAAINAAASIISFYISLPPALELGFSNTQWIQLGFAILVECRYTVASSSPERTQAYLRTLKLLRQRVEGLSTASVDHNGDRDVFVEFRNRIVQIQERLDRGKKGGTPGNPHFEGSVDNTQFINPAFTLQDVGSVEWTDLPQEMLGFMEDCQSVDDLLLNNSVEQDLNTWI
ncbi:unnamed protein product [Penicillium glandicola]